MRAKTFSALFCILNVPLAAGASLRRKPQLGARRCKPYKSLIETESALVPDGAAGSGLGAKGVIVADGFSRVACENDIAPASQRISFKEHACGEKLNTCRLTEMGMTPRLCFDFCRQYENAKFFGLIHGRDCYCSVYYHAATTGGGDCNAHCEGDDKEMCGGMEKSSLFEMHMCADSASEAQHALDMSDKAVAASKAIVEVGAATTDKLLNLAKSWSLGVCSVKPEGERVCALSTQWTNTANEIRSRGSEATHATDVLEKKTASLKDAQAVLEKDPKAHPKDVEVLTPEVRKAAAEVHGAVEVMKTNVGHINGPALGEPLKSFDVFKPLGDVKNNWYAVCALVPVPGESYAADNAKDDPAACATRCLQLSSGTEACAAFNYQFKDGLATCQMLTADGVVEPEDAINAAVPIFEVSKTKRDAMGISSMGCYAHGRFTAGHPKGPLGIKVIREVTV